MQGEVFALFPDIPGTNDPYTCMAYAIVGEHHSADLRYSIVKSKSVKSTDYKDIATILTRRGYDLEILKRVPSYLKSYETRLKEIKRV